MSTDVERLIYHYGLNDVIERFSKFTPEIVPALIDLFNKSFEFKDEKLKERLAEEFTVGCCRRLIEYDEKLLPLKQNQLEKELSETLLSFVAYRVYQNGITSIRDQRTFPKT